MLNCIAYDISKITKTDPSRAENTILDMQIDDIVEVAEKYLQGKPACLAPSLLVCYTASVTIFLR